MKKALIHTPRATNNEILDRSLHQDAAQYEIVESHKVYREKSSVSANKAMLDKFLDDALENNSHEFSKYIIPPKKTLPEVATYLQGNVAFAMLTILVLIINILD